MDLTGGWSWVEKLFLACALLGGGLFVVRTALMLIGADHGAEAEMGADVHMDVSHGAHDAGTVHDAADASVKLLTFQGVSAFVLMFGLVGLVLSRGLGLGGVVGTIGGIGVGTATMWLIARFFAALLGLQSSGTLEAKNAIGQEGTVYQRIPAGGVGKVQVVVQGRLEEFEAVSESNQEIPSGEKVRVVFLKGNVLVVEKI